MPKWIESKADVDARCRELLAALDLPDADRLNLNPDARRVFWFVGDACKTALENIEEVVEGLKQAEAAGANFAARLSGEVWRNMAGSAFDAYCLCRAMRTLCGDLAGGEDGEDGEDA